MTDKAKTNVEWEIFPDSSLCDLFAVRPVGDTDFNSPRLFHFIMKKDAELFKRLVERAHISIPTYKYLQTTRRNGQEVLQRLDVTGKSFQEVVDEQNNLKLYINQNKFKIEVVTLDRKLIEFDYFKNGIIK